MGASIISVFAFPTVVFTVGVALFILYSLLKMAGFTLSAIFDLFDSVLPDFGADGEGHNFLDTIGVSGLPATIVFGVTSICGWMASFLGVKYLGDTISPWLILFGALILGFAAATLILQPFRQFFQSDKHADRTALVGRPCVIRSTRVDGQHGTAEVDDGGGGFIAEVRCRRENHFTVGSRAVVQDYDPATGTYWVGDPSWT